MPHLSTGKTWFVWVMVLLLLGMFQLALAEPLGDSKEATTTETAAPAKKLPPRELEKLKTAIWVISMSLLVFMVGVGIITIQRMIRRHQRRVGLGQKLPPTDYTDAWKNYRLRDEDIKRMSSDDPS